MKILYISNNFSKGGAAKANLSFLNLLLKKGYQVDKLSTEDFSGNHNYIKKAKALPNIIIRLYCKLFSIQKHYSAHFGGIIFSKNFQHYDVMILGWLGNSTIDYRTISEFKGKIFYRLSDEFAINKNGLHYDYNNNMNFFEQLLSHIIRKLNKKPYEFFKIHCAHKIIVLSPSKWILNKVNQSDIKFKKNILVRNPKSRLMEIITNDRSKYLKKNKTSIFICDNLDDPRKGVKRTLKIFEIFRKKNIVNLINFFKHKH